LRAHLTAHRLDKSTSQVKNRLSITKDQFAELLAWLDDDPGRAGLRYEEIRRKLISMFLNRQIEEAEDLADDTINRVAKRVSEVKREYVGDPARYFYGVAKKMLIEYRRKRRRVPEMPLPSTSSAELEPHLTCLDECLEKLDPESRELILRYYRDQKQAKISTHKEMGERLRVNAAALRARAYRIRVKLEICVVECLKRTSKSHDLDVISI